MASRQICLHQPFAFEVPTETRPPLPPFTQHTAVQKVRLAEDGWNSRDPARVALAYTEDTRWRNRAEFPVGRDAARQLLEQVGTRTGLPPHQRAVGVQRPPHRRAGCLRMA